MQNKSLTASIVVSELKTARKHLISVSRVAPLDGDWGGSSRLSHSGTLDVRIKRRRRNSDSHQCCCSRHYKVGAKIATYGALGPNNNNNNNHLHNNLHLAQQQPQQPHKQLHKPELVTGRCRYCHRLLVKVKAKGVGGGTGVTGALKQWWRDVGSLCPSRRGSSASASAVNSGGGGGTNAAYSSMGHGLSGMCKIHRCPKRTKGLHLRHSEEPPRMPGETGVGGPGSRDGTVAGAGGILRLNRPSYDREHAHMEAWLDEHPDFVLDYFLRKATRSVVDAWLVSHATPTSSSGGSASTAAAGAEATSPTHPGGHHMPPNPHSRTGSGATTPVRKISAHEFSGLSNKPMVSTVDGTPTFLTTTTSGDTGLQGDGGVATTSGEYAGGTSGVIGHSPTPGRRQRRSRHELRQLDEKELIFELVKDICNELEIRSLCHKILQNVLMLLHADRGSLFLVQGGGNSGCGGAVTISGNNMQAIENSRSGGAFGVNTSDSIDDDEDEQGGGSDERSGSASTTTSNTADGSSTGNNARTALAGTVGTVLSATANGSNGSRLLVSKLFDVCSKSTLLEMEKKEEIRIPWGTGIVGYVAESGESVNIPNAYEDERFNDHIDTMTGYKTRTLLCMPIKDTNGDVIGVAQVINKVGDTPFTAQDEQVFGSYLQFCGIGLRNAHLYEKSQLEIKRNQVLLDLARMIFEEQSTIEHVVFRILTHTQSLIQCQRVQVLLVHQASKGSFSRVFDFEANDLAVDDGESRTSPFESRFPINIGITGYVATTGETLNIPCAYDDTRFDTSVDDNSNFKHKGILCMPIKNSSGQIIGVIQLINKFDETPFSKNDENFVEAFAIFCGMGIHNTHMYERAVVAIAKHNVTLEVLSYHATASLEDAQRLRVCAKAMVPSSANLRLHEFSFDDFHMNDDETITACIRMFLDLDLIERFHMDYEVLCRWLLSVKKNYRNVTYHNWRHAFNVAQMMFSILTATGWWSIFGEIECLALIIGCLCHDLDHRGTNNSFQIKASSPLAQLYSTSTMEHHHFDQCIMILNSPGNQLLSNVSSDEYTRVIRYVEEAILSTDLAVYFRKRGTFFSCVNNGNTFTSDEDRELMRAMLMTVCDLAAITKPWEVEKRVAELVSSEFFEQGDMEKEELNITPIDLMNRDKEDQLPLMQVGFIDSICLPIYEHFSLLSVTLAPLEAGVRVNRQHWLDIAAANRLLPTNGSADEPANSNGTNGGTEVTSEGNPSDTKQVTNGGNDSDDSSDNMKAESADEEDDDD